MPENQEKMVSPVFPVNRESPVKTGLQELKDHKVPQENRDHKENQARALLEKKESL